MNYKKIYEDTLKNICEKDRHEFGNIVEQEMPKFIDKTVVNENAQDNALFTLKLDENIANEQDYKEFCEYIYGYIGMNFKDVVDKNSFSSFRKED